jgi:hypothetical protein
LFHAVQEITVVVVVVISSVVVVVVGSTVVVVVVGSVVVVVVLLVVDVVLVVVGGGSKVVVVHSKQLILDVQDVPQAVTTTPGSATIGLPLTTHTVKESRGSIATITSPCTQSTTSIYKVVDSLVLATV